MDIDFYKKFDLYDSVSFNSDLWDDILSIDYLDKVCNEEEIIPEGYDGAGETLERVCMGSDRSLFIKGLAKLLIKYCVLPRDLKSVSAIDAILKTINLVNDESITHFKLDV